MNSEILDGWWRQHAELDTLLESVRLQIDRKDFPAASELVERLGRTLDAHFAAEEQLYFPLVARTSAQSARALNAARACHRRLRRGVAELLVSVEITDARSAQRMLSVFLHHLHRHEQEEVELILELRSVEPVNAPSGA